MLPYLQEVQNPSKKYTVHFRGINYGEGAQDGEFAETYNLSTDQYPCITQRASRELVSEYAKPTTLHGKGELLVIDGTDVYYGGEKVGEVTEGKKQTATVGNYIVIFPDKKYYKVPTEDANGEKVEGEFGSMEIVYKRKELVFTSSTITQNKDYKCTWLDFASSAITFGIEYKVSDVSFLDYSIKKKGGYFPFVAGDKVLISGCRVEENNIEMPAEVSEVAYEQLHLRHEFAHLYNETGEITITKVLELPFRVGEKITISGCEKTENNKEVVVKGITDNALTFDEGTFAEATENGEITITGAGFPFKEGDAVTITGCAENSNNKTSEILIRGVSEAKDELTFDDTAFAEATEEGEVIISRTLPDLEFICENNLRLWGTKGNNIYTSKYNDPMNFKVFEGLASDAWEIEEGGEGDFTGCMPYGTHICFFKENMLVKLYGTKPSNYSITRANVFGVQSGSEKSMQIVNEQLIYKGVGGVYAYTGGVPELISENFGNKRFSEAVACCDGEKYYISMKCGDDWSLYTYDVMKNIWLREDETHAVDMAFFDGKVYFLDAKGGLYYIDKEADRGDIEWEGRFCTFNETVNERKGYSKFHLRMDLSAKSWIAVDIKTENDLKWREVYTTHNEKAKTVSIPIIPTRCDSIDIRLRGKGKCTIKSFIREFTVGSDV